MINNNNNNNNNKLTGILTAVYPTWLLEEYIDREVLKKGLPKGVELASKSYLYRKLNQLDKAQAFKSEYKENLKVLEYRLSNSCLLDEEDKDKLFNQRMELLDELDRVDRMKTTNMFDRVDKWIMYGEAQYRLDIKTLECKAAFTSLKANK